MLPFMNSGQVIELVNNLHRFIEARKTKKVPLSRKEEMQEVISTIKSDLAFNST